MGFSVSASTAIVFAGLFLAVGILYPAASNGFEQIQDAQVDRDDTQVELRNTQIEIQSASTSEITVTNNGTTSLTVSEVDLIVDGVYQDRGDFEDHTSVDGNSETDLWLPGEALTIDFDESDVIVGSDDRIKIATEHGISVSTRV